MAELPMEPYYVVGRKDTGVAFDRISIEDMQKNHPYQFALFVRSYARIQANEHDLFATTYMQIAGIHGKSYEEWAGDRKREEQRASDFHYDDLKDTLPVPSRFGGSHGSVTFTTWHRPYVMLIEQAIGEVATRIAKDFGEEAPQEKESWETAAKELRFPYWDWAAPHVADEGLPPVLIDDMVEVWDAFRQTETIPNPLSYYTYQGGIPNDFEDEGTRDGTAYFSSWPRSFRHSPSDRNGSTNKEELQTRVKSTAKDIGKQLGLLFNMPEDMDPAHAYDEEGDGSDDENDDEFSPLETIHGRIHGAIGGNGHMSSPDYAAFDPFFFLHHSSVDRILALWEWCYPDYWMGDGYTDPRDNSRSFSWTQERGTYMQVYNEQLLPTGARGSLYPFRLENGEYWNSEQTRFLYKDNKDVYPKYYSYDEFLGIRVDQEASAEDRRAARKKIYKYYGFDCSRAAENRKDADKISWSHIPVRPAKEAGLPKGFEEIDHFRTFVVAVQLPEHAFDRTYSFELRYNQGTESRSIGGVTVFARPDHSPCKACAKRRSNGSIIHGAIPLPFDIVNELVVKSRTGNTTATFETTVKDIIKSLSGALVDTSGKVIATAQGGDETSPISDRDKLSSTVAPAKVAFTGDPDQPVRLFDWKRHNSLFPVGLLL
ncbi:common central domain of tyrosinase-domain-containing protein [Pisolithus tinctorius]|nr:common central domain of tyrosinase-domain-containing protein [Pisolithus tinctorius]